MTIKNLYRSSNETKVRILEICQNGETRISHISRSVNISHDTCNKFLNELIELKMIQKTDATHPTRNTSKYGRSMDTPATFRTSEKGRIAINIYKEFETIMRKDFI